MELSLDQNGDPESAFILSCVGRKVDFIGNEEGPHPLQIVPARWRTIQHSLGKFVDELAIAEGLIEPEGDALMAALRHLTYDATELFDTYAQLIPARLKRTSPEHKKHVTDYEKIAKRLRDDCAKLCNRCKHEGSQLKMLWAQSPSNGLTGTRVLVSSYNGRGGLLRDEKIHDGRKYGIGLVRWGHDLAHKLLRIDYSAASLMKKIADSDCAAMPAMPAALPVGAKLRKLAELRATRHADESSFHDGLHFTSEKVILSRVNASDFGPSANIMTTITMEAGTTQYSIA